MVYTFVHVYWTTRVKIIRSSSTYNISSFITPRVGISGTIAKSRQCKFVPSSHPGPFAVVATSRKSQPKVGTLACFDLL